jgi:hypothetical protein
MDTANRRLLRRKAASDYLRETHGLDRAVNTLAKLASIGGGPLFHRAGRIPLYARADLDAWALAVIGKPVRSTSEAAPAGAGVWREQRSAAA